MKKPNPDKTSIIMVRIRLYDPSLFIYYYYVEVSFNSFLYS